MEASTSQMYWTIGAIVMAAVVILALVTWLPVVTNMIAKYMNNLVSDTSNKVATNTSKSIDTAIANGAAGTPNGGQ